MYDKLREKDEINVIEEQIYNERRSINEIENAKLNLKRINVNFNKCIDLLSKSIVGPTSTKIIREIDDKQNDVYLSVSNNFEEKKLSTESSIVKLYKKKENMIDELKKKDNDKKENN